MKLFKTIPADVLLIGFAFVIASSTVVLAQEAHFLRHTKGDCVVLEKGLYDSDLHFNPENDSLRIYGEILANC